MPYAMTDLKVNDAVYIERGGSQQLEGVVAHLGNVQFADGDDWVGVRLTGTSIGLGRNDGSVKGVSYFSCAGPNSGVFVRKSHVSRRELTKLQELRLRRELAKQRNAGITSPQSPSAHTDTVISTSSSPKKPTAFRTQTTNWQLQRQLEELSEKLQSKEEEITLLQQSLSKAKQDLHEANKALEMQKSEPATTFHHDLEQDMEDWLHDAMGEIEQQVQSTNNGPVDFFKVVFAAKGAPQILLLGFLLSFGIGSTIAVVPDVLSDRYARLHHGYDGPHCLDFDRLQKPNACQQGADDAQAAIALTTFFQNMLTLSCNTTFGRVSDARGRRQIMILSILLYTLSPAVLILMMVVDSIDPVWYLVSFALVGVVNWISIGFSMLSDIIPPAYRAPSFGLFVSSFYFGFCIGPSCVLLFDHFAVSVLSLTIMLIGLLIGCIAMPETLPERVAERNNADRTYLATSSSSFQKAILRPIRDMSILNRDTFFRLLTVAYFFSEMVHSSDRSLLLFYMEDQLDIRDSDLATMLFIMGLVGVVVQGFLLEPLLACLGQKGLLMVSFLSGAGHNLLYGMAKRKGTIYVALCLSQLTKTNFPLISSIAANNVSENEQGRMQGALFALVALANAIGPVTLEGIYSHTKEGKRLGPGTMFVFASALYAVGTCFVFFIPSDKIKSPQPREDANEGNMEEPLLEENNNNTLT